jgi:hypothetical protein
VPVPASQSPTTIVTSRSATLTAPAVARNP